MIVARPAIKRIVVVASKETVVSSTRSNGVVAVQAKEIVGGCVSSVINDVIKGTAKEIFNVLRVGCVQIDPC